MTSSNTIKKPMSPRRDRPKKTPIGVLVLGMHRSGTSALTRVLNLLGCALPEALVGPSEGNELGHWESASAVTLNDEILASAGSNWNDWGPINADWRASGVRGQMVERATEVIREHKGLGPLFALKDPRLCRLADLWLDAADAASVDIRVVLMLRHPGEVSASLESRDLMAPGYGQLLWLRHTLDAEYLSRGRQRVVCYFDRLLLDWQDTINGVRQGLDLALPRNSPAAHAEIDRFLARDMRHHDAREDTGLGLLGASDWLRRTFEIMRVWSEKGEDTADHAELDCIRTEFDNAYPAFSRLLLSSGYSGEFAAGGRLRNQLQHQLVELSERARAIQEQATEIGQLRARGNELEGEIAALTAAYETGQARFEELQHEAAALREAAARAAELDGVVEDLRTRENELEGKIAALTAVYETGQTRFEELQNEAAALREAAAQAAELDGVVEQLRTRENELKGEIAALTAAYETGQAWSKELQREAAALHEATARAAVLDGVVEDLRQRESELADEARTHAAARDEAEAALEALGAEVESLRAVATRVYTLEVEIARLEARETELAERIEAQDAELAAADEATQSERKLRAEAERGLAAREAELAQEKLGNAELTGRILAAESAALQRQEELAQLWSQLEALQQAAGAAAAEIAAEGTRRTEAEAQLAEAARNLRSLAAEKGELEVRVRSAEAAALERQQEVAELWNQLGTVQQAAGATSAEATAERGRRIDAEARLAAAIQDLRALGSEKSELEVRVRSAEAAALERQQEVAELWNQLGTLQQAAGATSAEATAERGRRIDAEARLAAAMQDLRALESEKGELEVRVRNAEVALGSQRDEQLRTEAQMAEAKAVFDELAQLTRLLQASETEAVAAAEARAAAERRVAEQTQELIRLSALLSQENSRAEGTANHAEWLREMTRVAEGMPKWWGMMPEGWRRKREHKTYLRAGLFDAQQYLQNYPDVAANGMDPVRHYIQHGMAEGRQMWC